MPQAVTDRLAAARAWWRDERGLTLTELLWTAVLSLVVGGAAMTFMIVSIDQSNAITSRATAARQAETGLEQLVRDLRQAMSQDASGNALSVSVTSSATSQTTSVAFSIPTPGKDTTPKSVTWTCPSTAASATNVGSCTRTVGTGSAVAEIRGVQSAAFSPVSSAGATMPLPATNPASIGITLTVQVLSQADTNQPQTHILRGANGSPSTKAIVIQTSADLRNFA